MATPWETAIQQSKTLSIHAGSGASGGAWGGVFEQAVREFNRLSAQHKLGVKFVVSTDAPDPKGDGGANVEFSTASTNANFTAYGDEYKKTFNGTYLNGLTRSVKRGKGSQPVKISRAFIFVPTTPLVSVPGQQREAGDGIRLVIAVHELIHACGLEDEEHSKPDAPDVFMTFTEVAAGERPDQDKIKLTSRQKAPPITLSGRTIASIRKNWNP